MVNDVLSQYLINLKNYLKQESLDTYQGFLVLILFEDC